MATEEAAPPAPPPAEEAPPAVPAEAGAAAGEQEEKVEEEQEPAEVLPPPCFNLDELKLKVCGSICGMMCQCTLNVYSSCFTVKPNHTTITSFICKSIS